MFKVKKEKKKKRREMNPGEQSVATIANGRRKLRSFNEEAFHDSGNELLV